MAKYIANPVEVDAFEIEVVHDPDSEGRLYVHCSEGRDFEITPGMYARELPVIGGYVVIQADGYTYINPKHVFERKYHSA